MLTYISIPQITLPPKHFIDLANQKILEVLNGNSESSNKILYNTGYGDREYIRHGIVNKTVGQHSVYLGEEFVEWAKDYIHPCPYEAGASVSLGNDATIHGPHVDYRRKYNMVYILNPGGSNVRTVWYRERGSTIERSHAFGPEGKSYWVQNYADLEVIDDVVLEQGCWYLLNTKIIHSVENIEGPRSMLAISLPDMIQIPWKNRIG